MKLNKIFMALAATAIVGCTSDDLNDFSAKQAPEDSRMIELNENFVLAGVGLDGDITRTHWAQDPETKALVNKFLPIYAVDGATLSLENAANLEAQAVGLCWLGTSETPGTDVYTNYQFYHFGWLNNGETEADVDNCTPFTLYNGSLYSDIYPLAAGLATEEADPAVDFVGAIPAKSLKAGVDNLNYNSGVYKTHNKSIFGGQYIVYYPFNEDFKEAGTIPAIAETSFDWDIAAYPVNPWEAPELGKATFRYSAPVTIEGGYQAADFGLYNLSTLVRLRVSTVNGDGIQGDEIDQVVLYSESGDFLKQANLAADKIVQGQKGTALYAETKGTKTINVDLSATATTLDVKAATTVSAYLTVLPTTVDDLVVLAHDADEGKWARVAMDPIEFKAGGAQVIEVTIKESDLISDFVAVDDASLQQALNEARLVAVDKDHPATITLIGDITLETSPFLINAANDKFITITGGDIIVPEDVILRVNTNMESNVRVLGKSCCAGANGGILSVFGGTINNVTLEPTEARVTDATYDTYNPTLVYNGAATVAADKTIDVQAGNVIVRKAVEHKGNIQIAEGAKVTVENPNGDLQFMGSSVTNNGTIEVEKDAKFDMTDSNGNSQPRDGRRMTNNGTFIHNVDAGVGTAVQSMQQNGEYRCRVDQQIKLDDAFLQWTACSVIEMVNAGAYSYNLGTAADIEPASSAWMHNGKYIDIEVNSGGLTTFNNPVISSGNGDSKNIQIGNLTVNAGGLDIDYVTGTGKRQLTVHGDMTVNDDVTITDSKKITVTNVNANGEGNLTIDGATLDYKGAKKNEDGLAVTGNITVKGATGYFSAGYVDAINITVGGNFSLKDGAYADFGNRTGGADKTMIVTGTISNPEGCTFDIIAAGQNGAGSVLAWISCAELKVGGTFTSARPRVE